MNSRYILEAEPIEHSGFRFGETVKERKILPQTI
jgi:hypothetical protein